MPTPADAAPVTSSLCGLGRERVGEAGHPDETATGEGGASLLGWAEAAGASRPTDAGVGGGAAAPWAGGVAYAAGAVSSAADVEAGVRGGVRGVWGWDGRSGVQAIF